MCKNPWTPPLCVIFLLVPKPVHLLQSFDFRPASSWTKFSRMQTDEGMSAQVATYFLKQICSENFVLYSTYEEVHGSIPWQWVYQPPTQLASSFAQAGKISLDFNRPLAIQLQKHSSRDAYWYVISLPIDFIMLCCFVWSRPSQATAPFLLSSMLNELSCCLVKQCQTHVECDAGTLVWHEHWRLQSWSSSWGLVGCQPKRHHLQGSYKRNKFNKKKQNQLNIIKEEKPKTQDLFITISQTSESCIPQAVQVFRKAKIRLARAQPMVWKKRTTSRSPTSWGVKTECIYTKIENSLICTNAKKKW